MKKTAYGRYGHGTLQRLGLPPAPAERLASLLVEAGAKLDSGRVARFASFVDLVKMSRPDPQTSHHR